MATRLRRREYKLQVHGGPPPQAYIALPSEWVRKLGLEKGDAVSVYYGPDSEYLVVAPPGARRIKEALFVRR